MESKRFYTIQEVKEMLRSLGKEELLKTCGSLAIILIQYNLLEEARFFLDKGLEVATENSTDMRVLEGSVLMHICQSYLSNRLLRFQDFLSHIYRAQDLALALKTSDLLLATNLLTFLALYKIKEFRESKKYLQIVKIDLRKITESELPSKFSRICQSNLCGITAISEAALLIKLDNDVTKANKICKNALECLKGEDLLIRPLISDLIEDINGENEWLLTSKFENLLFITLFIPFIDSNCPLIYPHELSQKTVNNPKKNFVISKKRESQYKVFGTSNQNNSVRDRAKSIKKGIRRRVQISCTAKHWWEKPKFIDNALKGLRSQSRGRPINFESRYSSPARRKSVDYSQFSTLNSESRFNSQLLVPTKPKRKFSIA